MHPIGRDSSLSLARYQQTEQKEEIITVDVRQCREVGFPCEDIDVIDDDWVIVDDRHWDAFTPYFTIRPIDKGISVDKISFYRMDNIPYIPRAIFLQVGPLAILIDDFAKDKFQEWKMFQPCNWPVLKRWFARDPKIQSQIKELFKNKKFKHPFKDLVLAASNILISHLDKDSYQLIDKEEEDQCVEVEYSGTIPKIMTLLPIIGLHYQIQFCKKLSRRYDLNLPLSQRYKIVQVQNNLLLCSAIRDIATMLILCPYSVVSQGASWGVIFFGSLGQAEIQMVQSNEELLKDLRMWHTSDKKFM